MFKLYLFLAHLTLFSIISCNNVNSTDIEIAEDLNISEDSMEAINKDNWVITPDGSENYLNFGSEYIFDQENLHTFDLILSEENLNLINRDPAAEEYVEGMLIFEKDTISPVGIRYKGSIGAFVGCLDGPNMFEPSGAKICTKLSMKIKINWKGRNSTY